MVVIAVVGGWVLDEAKRTDKDSKKTGWQGTF